GRLHPPATVREQRFGVGAQVLESWLVLGHARPPLRPTTLRRAACTCARSVGGTSCREFCGELPLAHRYIRPSSRCACSSSARAKRSTASALVQCKSTPTPSSASAARI